MSVKTWDIDTLKNKLEYYKKLYKRTNDIKEGKKLITTIFSYRSFIDDYYAYYQEPSFPFIANQDRNFTIKSPKITEILVKANDYIYNNNIKLREEIIPINMSKDKILTTTRDFYENIGGIYWEKYKEYYDTNSIYINFLKPNHKKSGGNILRPRGATEAFININTFHGLFDIATSIHEHGHAIGASIDEEHIRNLLIKEVESIFFELLYLDTIDKKEYDPENIKLTKETSVSMYHSALNNIDAKYITTIQGIDDEKKAIKKIKNKYEIDPDYLDDILLSPMRESAEYSLSYLIAVELFLLYKRNSYAALNILEKIIRINSDKEDVILDSLASYGITPGKSLKSFYKQYLNIKGTSKTLH